MVGLFPRDGANWQFPDTGGNQDPHAVKHQKEQHKWDIEMLTGLRALPGTVNHKVVVDLTS